MIDRDKLIGILEREFREKRIYGDNEDLELFKQEKSKTVANCKILVNEYYSHGGYIYPDNKAAENDPSNYIEVSIESVQEAIKNFTTLKINGASWLETPMYRIDLKKPPVIANLIPMNLSQYFDAITPRKIEIFEKNPYNSHGKELRSLALKRNDIVLKMRENPEITNPQSDFMKNFKNIYSEMVTLENSIIKSHIESNIGEIKYVIYIDDDEFLPFYIYQIENVNNQDHGAILTSGFSMLPLSIPKELQFIYSYLEFIIAIPPDFPLPLKNDKNYEYYWLIEKLIFFIHYIHRNHTYFLHGHTYGNGNPPKPFTNTTDLSGFLFQFPFQVVPPHSAELIIPHVKNIHFLQMIPLYENELHFALEKGGDDLIQIFKENNIPLYLVQKRKNSLSKKDYSSKDYGKSSNFCKKCGAVIREIEQGIKNMKCPKCGETIKLK